MLVAFDGRAIHKAFHDPETGTLDLWSAEADGEGHAVAWGDGLVLVADEDGTFAHLSLEPAALDTATAAPSRPADAARAVEAGVELCPDETPALLFDGTEGTLRLRWGALEPVEWARLGDSLVWLGIDGDARLAALVVEGVSRDPGSRAQATWLAEQGIG